MKISLVIPTKNRLETLRHCLESCFASTDKDFELIVSNNQSEDATKDYLNTLDPARCKVITTPSPLSMRANFEFTLDHVTGDYVFYIGDDDGLTNFGIGALKYILRNTGAEALNWKQLPYVWPRNSDGASSGNLVLRSKQFNTSTRKLDPLRIFQTFLDGTNNNYMDGAKIYHGCVSRKIINKVREKAGGQYFGAMSPDVFVAIANLKFLNNFQETDCAISISGKSPKSNGWANLKATGDRKRADLFFKDEENSAIPDPRSFVDLKIRSLRAHELDALILAIQVVGSESDEINYSSWVVKIIEGLNCIDEDEYADNVAKIENLANQVGITPPQIPPFKRNAPIEHLEERYLKIRPKNIRCKSAKLKNVQDAAIHAAYPQDVMCSNNKLNKLAEWAKIIARSKRNLP